MTQAGCYQLVLDRKLGEYRLPDGWVVIAAGNPASERGVHFSMPRPLRNRFVHLDLEPDFEDWCKWAVKAGIRPEIIAFLRFKPALLHDADATSDHECMADASLLGDGLECAERLCAAAAKSGFSAGTTEIEAQLLEGTIGQAATSELVAFLRLFRQLPSIDEILLNPDTAPLPEEPSARIAIATALGRVMTDHSIAKGCGISIGCPPRCGCSPCAMQLRGIAPSPTRRSLFASASNMRRSSNDYRTSHAGRGPHQHLDRGQTRSQGQPRGGRCSTAPAKRGPLQQATAARRRQAG